MPMFDYCCPKCGDRLEVLLTIAEFEHRRFTCPKCKKRMKKVMFAPPFHSRASLMNPRHMRGQKGEFIKQKGCVIE